MGLFHGLKTAALAAGVMAASAPAAIAQNHSGWRGWWWWNWNWNWGGHGGGTGHTGGTTNAVPEIDAGAGLLAVAAVMATLALAWELRRRNRHKEG
ncbi:VPEID-CTERM sorting domain-containing protein [Shimia sp. R9_2]|uniref:VPEID-CTERM sorting domain-containing protein n=1 Tax=Shimia sp. R9_2 TaxID=2821112 RepID=UPI001FFE251A|nr:VPEID-CTERM sorting domain-containing protein [Shimia sp. R9_2]